MSLLLQATAWIRTRVLFETCISIFAILLALSFAILATGVLIAHYSKCVILKITSSLPPSYSQYMLKSMQSVLPISESLFPSFIIFLTLACVSFIIKLLEQVSCFIYSYLISYNLSQSDPIIPNAMVSINLFMTLVVSASFILWSHQGIS